jgi:hypothetical protein
MSFRRFLGVWLLLFVIALLWNGFVHLVLLREVSAAVEHLRRPDLAEKTWLSLLLTAGVLALFLLGYTRVARTGSLQEGLAYGLSFALLAGLLVNLNQYILFPIPGSVALSWFASGLLEFALYGALVSRLSPVRRQRPA